MTVTGTSTRSAAFNVIDGADGKAYPTTLTIPAGQGIVDGMAVMFLPPTAPSGAISQVINMAPVPASACK
ncbi:MAG: hypothetical protein JWM80_4665 [Cyanobacteria bacterium RYN_339]|nr:hypothetical protein [Cyanobacteria bacterium RYN_339]